MRSSSIYSFAVKSCFDTFPGGWVGSDDDKGWSFPDGNRYKNVRYDVFLDLSLFKTSPVNFLFNSIPNLCETTYGIIILARLSKFTL